MAIPASTQVQRTDGFREDVRRLAESFPDVEKAVEAFADALRLGYDLPMIPADDVRGAFVHRLDDPSLGSEGVARFRVLFLDAGVGATTGVRVWVLVQIDVVS